MDLPTIKKHAHLPVVLAGHGAEGGIDSAADLRGGAVGDVLPVVLARHGAEGGIDGAADLCGGAVGDVLLEDEADVLAGGPQPAQ